MEIQKTNQIQQNIPNSKPVQTNQQETSAESIFDEPAKEKEKEKRTFGEFARDTYNAINDTLYKIGDKVNKDFNELTEDLKLDKIIHELELDKPMNMENLDGGFILSTGFKRETKKINEEEKIESSTQLNIKNGKPAKVIPEQILQNQNLKDYINFQTSKVEVEQKYTFKNEEGLGSSTAIGFKKEELDNKDIVTSESASTEISSSKLLWNNEDKTSKLSASSSLSTSLVYSDKFSFDGQFLSNELAFRNGISTSLTYQITPLFDIKFSGNGSYTISTQKDSYVFGTGINVVLQPIPEEKEFKLYFGTSYSQSDKVNPENTNYLNQKIGLSAKMDFNRNFGMEAGYDIHLDNNNQNNFSFGVIIR